MGSRHLGHDGQAEAGPTPPTVAGLIEPGEPIGHPFPLVEGYPGAIVVDGDDGLTVAHRQGDDDLIIAVAGGIVDQIPEGPGDEGAVGHHANRGRYLSTGTLDRPTDGRVTIEGTLTSELPDVALAGLRSNRIGFVFQ